MAEHKSLIALDPSASGNNQDTLVTVDTTGGAVYFVPSYLVAGHRSYLTKGFTSGIDEDGNPVTTSTYGGTRTECKGYPWLASGIDPSLDNFNALASKNGFLIETYQDETFENIIEWNVAGCNSMQWQEGGHANVGSQAIYLTGLRSPFFHSDFDETKIYPAIDHDGNNVWTQHDNLHWTFNQGKLDDYIPCVGNTGGYAAHRIDWLECEKSGSKAMVGQSIHVKGYEGLDGTVIAGKQNGKTIGIAVEVSGSTHNDQAAIYAKAPGVSDRENKRAIDATGEVYVDGQIKVGGNLTHASSKENQTNLFMTLATDPTYPSGGAAASYIRTNGADSLYFEFQNDDDDPSNSPTGSADGVAVLDKQGNFTVDGNLDSWVSSDMRLKDNAKPIEGALDKLKTLTGYTFDWNMDDQDYYEGSDVGVMAQEVEEVFPEIVKNRRNGFKAVKYDKLVPVLIESVKTLSDTIEKLEAKIEKLEASSNRSDSF